MMYSDVVMEKAEDIEPAEGKGIRVQLEHIMAKLKKSKKYKSDTDLTAADLKRLCEQFKEKVAGGAGPRVPRRSATSSFGAPSARCSRAGTAAGPSPIARSRAFPASGAPPATCRAWSSATWATPRPPAWPSSRNPATGENKFYGEWLVNAQGEDVVAGIRTPNPLNEETKNPQNQHLPSLQTEMAGAVQAARRHPHQARTALPRHAGHRVHDPGRQALHAPVPQRQADRHRGLEHGHGHARREADRREDGRHARAAGAARRAAAPDHQSGRREEGRGVPLRVCRPARAARAARSSSPRSTPSKRPSRARR